jgi:adenine phosphoribosyltransferase
VCELVERLGGVVAGCAFLIELTFLNGRERLARWPVLTLIEYAG